MKSFTDMSEEEIKRMTRKSPQQEIYDAIYLRAEKVSEIMAEATGEESFEVFNYLPHSNIKRPFVFIGEQFNQDIENKTVLSGDVQQTIHIYGKHTDRRKVTDIANKLQSVVRDMRNTSLDITIKGRPVKHEGHFYTNVKRITNQTLIDNTTPETLVHMILEIEVYFN